MPTWDKIKEGLTPEVLDKALKLKEPALLLIPPTTRQLKVEALNKHKVEGQEHDTYTHDLKNDDLWHSGESEKNKKWIVAIVEGVQEVEADENIDPVQMTNHKMSKAWKEKFKSQGLDIMEGADAYLTLMMKSLQEGTPLDKKYWTVLNAKNSEQTSFVAGGGCGCDRVYLDYGYPSRSYHSLRARGSVRVDVPWNQ